MISDELKAQLESEGYFNVVEIEGRGICAVQKYLFTFGIVYGIDLIGYEGRWCYADYRVAILALSQWDGKNDPPYNWIKYKGKGGERENKN